MALYLSPDYQTSFESFSLPARKKFKTAILDFQSEPQNRISTWLLGRPWISDQNNLAIFYLQVTTILPFKFRVD